MMAHVSDCDQNTSGLIRELQFYCTQGSKLA